MRRTITITLTEAEANQTLAAIRNDIAGLADNGRRREMNILSRVEGKIRDAYRCTKCGYEAGDHSPDGHEFR